jgi:hypothetical protein
VSTTKDKDKVYVGIPRAIIPLLLGLASAAIIGTFTLVFALFSRVSNIEADVTTIKTQQIPTQEWTILRYEHSEIMEDRKSFKEMVESNKKLNERLQKMLDADEETIRPRSPRRY